MSYDSQTSTTLINKLRKDVDSLTLKVAVLTDSKTSGTSGGNGVAAAFTARELNTIAIDPNGLILDLTANQFKLAAGAYQIRAIGAFKHTRETRMRIYDVTASAEASVDVVIGYSVSADVSNTSNQYLDLNVRVQPHKDNVYRLEYFITAAGANHLGVPTSLASIDEIFAICEITRLDTGLTKPSGGSGIQGAPGPAGPAGPAGPPGPAGGGTVTNVSVVTANGVSGSVATSTTTPAITLALGAITPSSVAATGPITSTATVTGSNLSGVNTGDQVIILSGDRMLTEGNDFLITESGDYILETGDVTGQGTGRIPAVITPQAVTYDKMQFISTANRLLGRATSVGTVEEISLGSGLSFSGTVLSATGTGGTVTNVSVTAADGITASVGTSTTTPAISLGLGSITPTSVASTGTVTGTNLSGTHTGTSSGTNTGDQTITLTGPVTGSGTGSFATTITTGAVTYDKIQLAGAIKRLLGSDGTGTSIGEINLGANLSMTGNTLSASAPGTGTVTSVNADGSTTGMSFTGGPVTTSGTLTLGGTLALSNGGTGATSAGAALTSLGAYPANNPNGYNTGTVTTASVVTANGVSGTVANDSTTPAITIVLGAIVPTSVAATGTVTGTNISGTTSGTNTGDQAIVLSGDVSGSGSTGITTTIGANTVTYAKMQAISASSKLLGSSASSTAVAEITLGTNLSMTGSTLNAAGSGSGTVTSVDVAGGTTGLTTSGGPVIASGTITLGGTLSVANGGTSSTSASSAISFLAGATTNGQYLRGNGTVVQMSAIQAVDLPQIALGGSAVSGTLGVINGGTGQSNVYTNGDILIGNSTGGTLNRNKIVGTAPITVTNGAGTITIGASGIGSGDVVGPASSNTNALAKFSSATGKLIGEAGWNENGGDLYGPGGSLNQQYGFVYIPADIGGAPSTAPAQAGALADRAAMYFDLTNNKLYVYNHLTFFWIAIN